MSNNPENSQKLKFIVWLSEWSSPSLYAGLLLLATTVFYWAGVDLLTLAIFSQVASAIWAAFSVVFFGALVKACLIKDQCCTRKFRFVIWNLVVWLTANLFQHTPFGILCDFTFNFNKRMKVVEMARNNKLRPAYRYNMIDTRLPPDFQYLSWGGDVKLADADPSTLHVFFYNFQGLLGHHCGFDYSADGNPPAGASEAKQFYHLRKNWYWIAH